MGEILFGLLGNFSQQNGHWAKIGGNAEQRYHMKINNTLMGGNQVVSEQQSL